MGKNHNGRNSSWWRSNHNQPVKPNNSTINANSQEIGSFKLPEPTPDYIYENRKYRAKPSQSLFDGPGWTTYIPQRLEHIKGEGNFVHYYGCPFPSKCIAEPEAIYAIGPVKRRFVNLMRLMSSKEAIVPLASTLFIGKKRRGKLLNKALQFFNDEADMTLAPWYIKGYYCKFAYELGKGVSAFLVSLGGEVEIAQKTGKVIASMFEYDNAYRFSGQDALTEANKDELLNHFPQELNRLFTLVAKRDKTNDQYNPESTVYRKFLSAGKILKLIWFIPSFKRAIKNAINAIDWERIKLEESDFYLTILYSTYDTAGKTMEERWELYKKIHGEDMSKWPPRMTVRNKQ